MFEKATRLKIRFATSAGQLAVEDLWDLPLTSKTKVNLDDIASNIHKNLKSGDDVSFVVTEKKSNPIEQLRFDIVKYIIDTKLAENAVSAAAKAKSEQKQKILEIISQKEDESLLSMPLEELKKLIEA